MNEVLEKHNTPITACWWTIKLRLWMCPFFYIKEHSITIVAVLSMTQHKLDNA